MSLTDTALRALKPRASRYEVTDRDGLQIEVQPSGRMTWRYRYVLGGRREKVTLGRWPAIGLAEARRRRAEYEAQVARGQSPVRERKRQREVGILLTMDAVAERWIEEVLKPATRRPAQDVNYWRRDCSPRIGAMAPDQVTTADVRACVDAVLKRGHGQAARRVRNVLKRLFEYAQGLGVVRSNPAVPVRPVHIAPTVSRKRVLRSDEIPSFVRAIYGSRLARPLKLALHVLLLVPVRKGELTAARREHFDLQAGTWDIPAEVSKNGAPIRHKLPRQALALVRELLEGQTTEWLLPSNRGLGLQPIARGTLNQALGTVEGLPAGIVVHDLRRTIRTGLADLGGVPDSVAELCLNHRPQGVAGVYDRAERLAERADALQRWADHVDALMLGGGNVVAFQRPAVA